MPLALPLGAVIYGGLGGTMGKDALLLVWESVSERSERRPAGWERFQSKKASLSCSLSTGKGELRALGEDGGNGDGGWEQGWWMG